MKIALRAKVSLRWAIALCFTNLFLCLKQWRFRMQKLQWTRNGKSSRQSEKVKSKKEVILEAQRDKKKDHFAALMDLCHLKNGDRTEFTKIQRQCRAPWWLCKRRLWSLRSLNWTGLVCVPNDCRESTECCCKMTRLWRTSSWRSVSLYPSKIGGRP